MSTNGNDFEIVTRGSYAAGQGNDTYYLNASRIDANATITITDTVGTNKIQLLGGLEITSSKVTSTAAELTLSNGAKVTIYGADSFNFKTGGSSDSDEGGQVQPTFNKFASAVLGVTLPTTGLATGVVSKIQTDGTARDSTDKIVKEAPPGIIEDTTNNVVITNSTSGVTGVEENFVWTQSSAVGHSTLSNFGITEDTIQFDLAGTAQLTTTLDKLNGYSLSGEGMISVSLNQFKQETIIGLGNDSQGQPLALTLVGVSDASQVDVSVI